MLAELVSAKTPIDFKLQPQPDKMLKSTSPCVATAGIFPTAFSKAPTSSPSDLLTCIFCPSRYSPEGSNLLYRS